MGLMYATILTGWCHSCVDDQILYNPIQLGLGIKGLSSAQIGLVCIRINVTAEIKKTTSLSKSAYSFRGIKWLWCVENTVQTIAHFVMTQPPWSLTKQSNT